MSNEKKKDSFDSSERIDRRSFTVNEFHVVRYCSYCSHNASRRTCFHSWTVFRSKRICSTTHSFSSQTFHTPSFGDEDFDIPAIHSHSHQQHQQQQQQPQQQQQHQTQQQTQPQHDPMHGYQTQVNSPRDGDDSDNDDDSLKKETIILVRMLFADDANRQRSTIFGRIEFGSWWISTIPLPATGSLDATTDQRKVRFFILFYPILSYRSVINGVYPILSYRSVINGGLDGNCRLIIHQFGGLIIKNRSIV